MLNTLALQNNNAVCVTFGTDWAPDWRIAQCYEMRKAAGVGTTFFITNPSSVLADIAKDPDFEPGIHPNFLPGSSHGKTVDEVLDYCSVQRRVYFS